MGLAVLAGGLAFVGGADATIQAQIKGPAKLLLGEH